MALLLLAQAKGAHDAYLGSANEAREQGVD